MKGDMFLDWIDKINEFVGKTVSWLFLILVFCVVLDILMRAFVGQATFWGFDINYMIYGTMFMLAGAYTLKHDAHVRVDVIFYTFNIRTRAILENLFYLLIMIPFCVILLKASWSEFIFSVSVGEKALSSSWRPPIYPYKAIGPLAFGLLLLQSLNHFIRNFYYIFKR